MREAISVGVRVEILVFVRSSRRHDEVCMKANALEMLDGIRRLFRLTRV